tara:strand:+ start:422 stop:628 length:207 start_codon:yes stop_codon:yes gene_type:complete
MDTETKCSICSTDIDEENGDVVGNFGMLPTAFCVWCYSSVTDMVIQLSGFDDIAMLEERIKMLKDDEC